jgi:signal transduction histidine kinase
MPVNAAGAASCRSTVSGPLPFTFAAAGCGAGSAAADLQCFPRAFDALRVAAPETPREPRSFLRELGARISPAQRRVARRWAARGNKLSFTLRLSGERLVFERVGEAFARSLGLQPSDLVERPVDEALPASLGHRFGSAAARAAAQAAPVRWTQVMALPEGRRTWRVGLVPGRRERTGAIRLHGLVRVIGEAEEIRRAGGRIAGGPAAVFRFVTLPSGAMLRMSEAFFDFTGLDLDAPQERIAEAVHPEDLQRVVMLNETGAGCTLKGSVRVRRSDGQYANFQLTADLTQGMSGRRWYGVLIPTPSAEEPARAASTAPGSDQERRAVEIDADWRIVALRRPAAELLGLCPGAEAGVDLREAMEIPEPLRQRIEACLATGRSGFIEVPGVARPWASVACTVWSSGAGVNVALEEVTELAPPERLLDLPDQVLGVANALPAEMLMLDETGAILSVNAACRANLGSLPTGGAGYPFGQDYLRVCRDLAPEIDPAVLRAGMDDLLQGRASRFAHTFVRSGAGGIKMTRVRITPFQLGEATRLIVLQEDLTGVVQTEAALRDATERLLNAQEQERERIAIELHDSTSQHLIAVGLGMAKLRRLVGSRAQTQEVLDDVAQSLEEAVKEIRVISYLMKPPGLERNGLAATARMFVTGFGRRTGLSATYQGDGALEEIDETIAHAAFRVLQEALSNVYRHAEARSVDVELALRAGMLTVRISDDGKGIGHLTGAGAGRIGVGISGMRVRVAQLGGELDISGRGRGTTVVARLPCPGVAITTDRAAESGRRPLAARGEALSPDPFSPGFAGA